MGYSFTWDVGDTSSYLTNGYVNYKCYSIKNVLTITVGAEPAERLGATSTGSKEKGPPVPPVQMPESHDSDSNSSDS